ncbi:MULTISPECIES: dihydrolipoyl dehydrogenase [unclassified Dysgonomonas]|jgi:dihydrolipoamide dehydrogenase|uniref:dihydrolipoyl dehydrogenase n=1 Tax=unclassified Dysgonomonas TaxID=2630389 RepID=UPI0025C1A93D|nr:MULTISPECIES: dihydrolipoyl dehydrogenase [unclassified Dysgonomonas]HMM01726.1 dihydrolipoyl dehydrogenase [Dysgonomonas sp.]
MEHDIAIIGGGPAGYNAAEKAALNGLRTILFEKNAIGGVCLNEGCIPTKTLLYSAKTLDNIKSASKYGISVEGKPTFDLPKIISRKDKVVKKLTAGVSAKLSFNGVTVVQGAAGIVNEDNGLFQIKSGENTYSVKYILLCTGSETIIPPIKGLSEVDYWTSKEALESKELPKSLAIIGGGVIGIEFASFFNSMGVKVNVIEMMPEILGAMDKETSAMLRTDYTKKGVTFRLNTKVVEVTKKGVVVEKDGKSETIEADRILVSVGRRPIVKGFGLENLNIEMLRNGIKVNEYMQTSNPRVYAAGDVTGFSLLAHTAIREGEVAISHIVGEDDKMSYKAIPGVVYTNPELAGVGKTEEELNANGESFRVLKLPMAYSGRFVAENEVGNGLCKIIVDDDDRIIGCHMLGNPASELIVIAGIAIENGDTVEEFRKHVYPHPTVSEIIHETLFS